MSRIAAPMLGGMLSAPLLSLLVVPAEAGLRSGRHGANFSREIAELAETRHPTPTTRAQGWRLTQRSAPGLWESDGEFPPTRQFPG